MIADTEFRAEARARVERASATRTPPTDCGHDGHMEYANCVVCAWYLGYAEGVVAAGAYLTSDEAFGSLRRSLEGINEPSVVSGGSSPADNGVRCVVCGEPLDDPDKQGVVCDRCYSRMDIQQLEG